MGEHAATIRVASGGAGAWLTIGCTYDMADETRPCWPYNEDDTPDPAPQNICTWEQWADALGTETLADDWEMSGLPVSCTWEAWDAPSFAVGPPELSDYRRKREDDKR